MDVEGFGANEQLDEWCCLIRQYLQRGTDKFQLGTAFSSRSCHPLHQQTPPALEQLTTDGVILQLLPLIRHYTFSSAMSIKSRSRNFFTGL